MDALCGAIIGLPRVYIIVDALDESTDLSGLMRALGTVIDRQLPCLHTLVTSRREAQIALAFEKWQASYPAFGSICLETGLVDPDIKAFVRSEFDSNKRLRNECAKRDLWVCSSGCRF